MDQCLRSMAQIFGSEIPYLEDETFKNEPKVEANSSLLISSDEDEKPKKVSRITIKLVLRSVVNKSDHPRKLTIRVFRNDDREKCEKLWRKILAMKMKCLLV